MQARKRSNTTKPKVAKKRGRMNRLEADFHAALNRAANAHAFYDCYYEAITFLASRCEVQPGEKGDTNYCADFVLADENDRLSVFEVKGGMHREKGRLKVKATAERWGSIAFYLVERRTKQSDWILTPYGRRACEEVDQWRGLLNNRES